MMFLRPVVENNNASETPGPFLARSVLPSVQELLHGTISWLLLCSNLCRVSLELIQTGTHSEHTVFSLLDTLKVKV